MNISYRLITAGFIFSVGALSIAQAAPVEYITNGNFETGDFTGWTIINSGSGAWNINNGTFVPVGPGLALSPISGSYDIVSDQGGPGLHIATQPISLPTAITSATLNWADRIRNHAGVYSEPNQEWRVQIEDILGNLLYEVFSTSPGDPLMQVGPNNRSFDLTALMQSFEGQQIVISFEEQDNLSYFNATLDDVSFKIEQLTLSCLDGGFESPFNNSLSLSPKQNRAIPTKMVLLDADGNFYTDQHIVPPVLNVSFSPLSGGGAVDVTDDLLPAGRANDDNIFRWDEDGQKWIYNLGTKVYKSAGTYKVTAIPGSSDYTIDSSCMGEFQRN